MPNRWAREGAVLPTQATMARSTRWHTLINIRVECQAHGSFVVSRYNPLTPSRHLLPVFWIQIWRIRNYLASWILFRVISFRQHFVSCFISCSLFQFKFLVSAPVPCVSSSFLFQFLFLVTVPVSCFSSCSFFQFLSLVSCSLFTVPCFMFLSLVSVSVPCFSSCSLFWLFLVSVPVPCLSSCAAAQLAKGKKSRP